MKKDTKNLILATTVTASVIGLYVLNDEIHRNNREELLQEIDAKKSQIVEMQKEIKSITEKNESLNKELVDTLKQLNDANFIINKYNANVSFNEHNVTTPSNSTLSHMQRALKDTELYNDSKSFIEAEQIYNVNAYFLAAICANESSWGTSNRAINQNNLSGYAVYNDKAKGANFESRHDSIMATAKLLKENYLTPGSMCFNGYSVVDVNKKYCFLQDQKTIDFNWSSQVKSIASDLVYKANKFTKI